MRVLVVAALRLAELQDLDGAALRTGAVLVSAPGLQELQGLVGNLHCLRDAPKTATFHGTTRYSAAFALDHGLPVANGTWPEACPDPTALRWATWGVALEVARKADAAVNAQGELFAAVEDGQHLEHFHWYEGVEGGDAAWTLPLHTDPGLFLVMSPAVGGSLFVEVAGALEEVVVPAGAVLVLAGEAARRYGLPAVPHGVTVHASRGWHGFMLMPQQPKLRRPRIGPAQFAPGCELVEPLALVEVTKQCGQDEKFCWMHCLPTSQLNCSKDAAVCYSTAKQQVCDPMQMPCQLMCPADINKDTQGAAFCNGYGTDMFMGGFVLAGSAKDSCLIFLHPALVMDSGWKFTLGCLATIALGVLNEYVVSVRRNFRKCRLSGHWLAIGTGALYVVNLILGYLIMLLAMTYSYEIFAMVLCGLLTGHMLFNRFARITESTDACCLGDAEGDDHRVDSTNPRLPPLETPFASHVSAAGEIPVDARRVVFRIGGMTCGACVNSVVTQLRLQPGVLVARASLAEETAVLAVDASYKIDGVVEAIEAIGFTAAEM